MRAWWLLGLGLAACGVDPLSGPLPAPPEPTRAARGVTLTDVDLYQVVQVPLARAGASVASEVPLVAGKDAVVHVGFALDDGFAPRDLVARLTLTGVDAAPVELTKEVSASTDPSWWESGFAFSLPGPLVVPGLGLQVELLEASPGAAGALRPASWSSAPLPITDVGAPTRIVVVPIQYDADGSGRLPDTSAAQLELDRARVRSMFPTPDVQLELGPTWVWDGALVAGDGSGWVEILAAFANDMHGPGSDPAAYYVGLVQPVPTDVDYGSGIYGMSFSSIVWSDAHARSSIALGWGNETYADVFAHELGHAHGLFFHAPCGGADAEDPKYPYPSGSTGVPGFDVAAGTFNLPDYHYDLMSYCFPLWVSDYNYGKLFARTQALGAAASFVGGAPARHRASVVSADGRVTLVRRGVHERPLGGELRRVRVLGARGEPLAEVEGHLYAVSHAPGGVLFTPDVPGAEREELLTR